MKYLGKAPRLENETRATFFLPNTHMLRKKNIVLPSKTKNCRCVFNLHSIILSQIKMINKMMNRIFILLMMTITFVGAAQTNDNIIYIQNSKIKLGVNLDLGGAITYLSESSTEENMINNYDWGRQIQMSFYSGPKPYIPESGQQPHKTWASLGWNPIQSGDVGGYKSKVVEYYHDKDSIYIKSIPMQWPLANEPGECSFESSIKIKDNVVYVNSRIRNNRIDKTQYAARAQELPAVYVNAPYHKLVTYKGNKPFKNDAISEIPQNSETKPKWSNWQATENWVAHLNENNFGLGIYTPNVQSYIGGFYGKKGKGGTKDMPTGYCAPVMKEILDHNIVYDYSYNLIVGNLKEIRAFSTQNKKAAKELKYSFKKDRNHIYYNGATDQGFPVKNKLVIQPQKKHISINGPRIFYPLYKNFNFYIEALFPKNTKTVNLICDSFNKKDKIIYKLPVQADNRFHHYQINLKNKKESTFFIGQLKINIEFDEEEQHNSVQIKEFGIK